jgi:hypothetical protein
MPLATVWEEPNKSATKTRDIFEEAALITGRQMRMARAALRWSCEDLAEKTGLSYGTLQKAEATDDMPRMVTTNLARVKVAFERAGIEFMDDDGVKMRGRK